MNVVAHIRPGFWHCTAEDRSGDGDIPRESRPGDWTCTLCGNLNFANRENCYNRACGANKAGELPADAAGPAKKRKADAGDAAGGAGGDVDSDGERDGGAAVDALDGLDVAAPAVTDVRDVVIPLHKLSYDEQLKRKQEEMEHALKRIRRKLRQQVHREDVKGGADKDAAWKALPYWIRRKDTKSMSVFASEGRLGGVLGSYSGGWCFTRGWQPVRESQPL